jgi:outer membrane protein
MIRIWVLFAVTVGFVPGVRAADLVAVYERALQNDPQLREAEANRLAALEAKPQAISALLPQLSANGYYTRERDSGIQEQVQRITDPTSPTGTSTLRFSADGTTTSNTHQYSLDLRQSVFNWSNWVALKRADAQVAQAEADYQSARQDLVSRVAQAYFDVLAAQDDLEAQQAALESIGRQLDQAEKRFDVGLIAVTDVQEANAAHDSSVAAVIAAKRALATAHEALREITGDTFDTLARPVDNIDLITPNPANEEQWVQKALEQNVTLLSNRLAADIARENIAAARSGYGPSVDLIASGGKHVSDGDIFYTAGGNGTSAIDQDTRTLTLQVTVPLYSGGMTSSRVREAVYRHRASKERLERIARQTERDTRDAYLGVLSEISRVKALKQALDSNITALKATEAGYEAGTRTAVDVLESRRLLILAQTNYSRSRYDYMLNLLKLQLEAGVLSRQSLDSVNVWLKESPPSAPQPAQPAPPQTSPPPPAATNSAVPAQIGS